MFSTSTKRLLKNHIRHTDTHNRIVEESDMWKQYELIKSQDKYAGKNSFLDDRRDDMNDSKYNMNSRSAHMDDKREKSTFWMRQLHKVEDSDPDRWGHSGFKELYPKDFNSDRSSSEDSSSSTSSEEERKRRRKKKRKKEKVKVECVEVKKSEKIKKKKKDRKKKKRSDLKKHEACEKRNVDSSESSDCDKFIPHKRLKTLKTRDNVVAKRSVHKKKQKHKKE